MPTLSHAHCQVVRKANRTSQNLSISMSLPTHREMDFVANLNKKNKIMKVSPSPNT